MISLFICKFPGREIILSNGMKNGILEGIIGYPHLFGVKLKSCDEGRSIYQE